MSDDKSHGELYGYRWQKARKAFLSDPANMLCPECKPRLVLATIVDHVMPHKGDLGLFWDRNNWRGLCKYHHDLKTSTVDGGFGNAPSNKPSKACNSDGIPTDPRSHWK